jgi:hypothetical protein
MGFIAPSIIGNIILWKVKTSFASLLGGLYIVSSKSPPQPPFCKSPSFSMIRETLSQLTNVLFPNPKQAATFYGALIQAFALIAANTAGHTKKTVINAIIVIVSNLGGFAGPFAYKGDEAKENYPTGQISAIILLVASLVAFTLLRYECFRRLLLLLLLLLRTPPPLTCPSQQIQKLCMAQKARRFQY